MFHHALLQPLRAFVDLSERMSRTRANYWAEFVVDSLFACGMIAGGLHLRHFTWPVALATVLAGLLTFSLLEYLFHRRLFHVGNSILARGHAAHHQNPLGYDALPFYLPALILGTLFGLFALFMPSAYAMLLIGAMTLGYILYGGGHFLIHHRHFHFGYLRRWAAHHHIHHVHPDKNFGVTTPLWDLLLGTRYISRRHRDG